jgi:type VI secretion system protein ImpG
MKVDLELDEDRFVGGGVFLFASVIEHFLAQYVSLNSFSQLAVTTRQRKERLREWNPRAGNRILI